MLIVKICGGLGNQLQQYALCEKLKSLGKEVKLDITEYQTIRNDDLMRDFQLDLFEGIEYTVATKEEIESLIGKNTLVDKCMRKITGRKNQKYTEYKMYDENIFDMENTYIEGYFACEYYYADIIGKLRRQLRFPVEKGTKNYDTAMKMQQECSVSVHIRRGDYLNPENRDIFGDICTDDYYKSALEYVERQYGEFYMYIFSDDISYAKHIYGDNNNCTIVDWNTHHNSYMDMFLMSNCKGNICANSTFSFWGARLNTNADKIMIRPLKQRNNTEYIPEILHPLWKNWILIDEKGKIV